MSSGTSSVTGGRNGVPPPTTTAPSGSLVTPRRSRAGRSARSGNLPRPASSPLSWPASALDAREARVHGRASPSWSFSWSLTPCIPSLLGEFRGRVKSQIPPGRRASTDRSSSWPAALSSFARRWYSTVSAWTPVASSRLKAGSPRSRSKRRPRYFSIRASRSLRVGGKP